MYTVIEIRDAIANKEKTARQITDEYLARIEQFNEQIGAFVEVYAEEARKAADAIDAKIAAGEPLPVLAGVPIAVKDNMLHKGHAAGAGSGILKDHVSVYTGTVVQRLLDAGAVIIGRTNMDDAAMGSSTETSFYQKTANPWDTARIPGGSSGGSAAAVAAGFVPVALGSDTGGSIRQPAAMCGVTGMKPSYGRVSRYGLIALASSLDQIGPITITVEDASLILSVIEGKDDMDATTVTLNEQSPGPLLSKEIKGMRIGVAKEFFAEGMDEQVKALVEQAIESMKELGAEIVEVSTPLMKYALPAYYIIQPAEAASNLARYEGMRYGTRVDAPLWESYKKARGAGFGREVKRRILLGNYTLSAGYYDAYYKKALAVRTAIHDELAEVFKNVDVMMTPTSPSLPWKLGEKMDDPVSMYLSDLYTVAANIAGTPGISVPCGLADGLPVGLQFLGGYMQDDKVLRAAHAYQSATAWHKEEAQLA